MIKTVIQVIVLAFSFMQLSVSASVTVIRDGWTFQKGENTSAHEVGFDDSAWEAVTVPHDWAIKGPFDREIDKQTVRIVQNNENDVS